MKIIFTISIEKEVTRIDKKVEEFAKNISYVLEFMANPLSNLANNLSEGIQELKVDSDTMIKYLKHVELNVHIVTVFCNI